MSLSPYPRFFDYIKILIILKVYAGLIGIVFADTTDHFNDETSRRLNQMSSSSQNPEEHDGIDSSSSQVLSDILGREFSDQIRVQVELDYTDFFDDVHHAYVHRNQFEYSTLMREELMDIHYQLPKVCIVRQTMLNAWSMTHAFDGLESLWIAYHDCSVEGRTNDEWLARLKNISNLNRTLYYDDLPAAHLSQHITQYNGFTERSIRSEAARQILDSFLTIPLIESNDLTLAEILYHPEVETGLCALPIRYNQHGDVAIEELVRTAMCAMPGVLSHPNAMNMMCEQLDHEIHSAGFNGMNVGHAFSNMQPSGSTSNQATTPQNYISGAFGANSSIGETGVTQLSDFCNGAIASRYAMSSVMSRLNSFTFNECAGENTPNFLKSVRIAELVKDCFENDIEAHVSIADEIAYAGGYKPDEEGSIRRSLYEFDQTIEDRRQHLVDNTPLQDTIYLGSILNFLATVFIFTPRPGIETGQRGAKFGASVADQIDRYELEDALQEAEQAESEAVGLENEAKLASKRAQAAIEKAKASPNDSELTNQAAQAINAEYKAKADAQKAREKANKKWQKVKELKSHNRSPDSEESFPLDLNNPACRELEQMGSWNGQVSLFDTIFFRGQDGTQIDPHVVYPSPDEAESSLGMNLCLPITQSEFTRSSSCRVPILCAPGSDLNNNCECVTTSAGRFQNYCHEVNCPEGEMPIPAGYGQCICEQDEEADGRGPRPLPIGLTSEDESFENDNARFGNSRYNNSEQINEFGSRDTSQL